MSGADLLAEVGTALYGPFWHVELARALGVTRRTVHRWEQGNPKQELGGKPRWADVQALIRKRRRELARLLRETKQLTDAPQAEARLDQLEQEELGA
jgi:transcriptional regulator with XRE-family HTH domain